MIVTAVCWAALLTAAPASPVAADTLVVCPPEFVAELHPWLHHRQVQGHRIKIIPPEASDAALRQAIRNVAREGGLRYVLLVGDAPPSSVSGRGSNRPTGTATPGETASPPAGGGGGSRPSVESRQVPTSLVPAQVNVKWGSEPELATDNRYADLDDDQLPDVAVGRLTPDTPAELRVMVNKILKYEQRGGMQEWGQRINFVAGVGGFNPLLDGVLETTTRRFLTDGIPASFDISMTYGSWRSPFCPDPREFQDTVLQRLNEGCLFWVYIGHGQSRGLDRVQTPVGSYPIFDVRDAARLHCRDGAPIAIFLACYTGAFDQPQDCLAEECLRAPGGPVAVLSGSRVTMPYAMAVLGNGLMQEYFQQRRATLGEVVLHAKRQLARSVPAEEAEETGSQRRLLDALAAALSPDSELLEAERLEHVQLFNLLGDPLLRLPVADAVSLEAPSSVLAGESLELRGTSPVNGPGTVELVCRHDTSKWAPPSRPQFEPTDDWLSRFTEAYARAHDRQWQAVNYDCTDGSLHTALAVPDEASGPCFVRVRIRGEQRTAIGAAQVFVKRKR